MKDVLVIIGASGHGKVIADIAIMLKKWSSIVFLDDDDSIKTCIGLPVIGNTSDAHIYKSKADIIVGIGNNSIRKKIQENMEEQGFTFTTVIHPSAVIGTKVEVGIGTAIMAGVIINNSSTIGKGCIINTGSNIDHDNLIEDFVHISPGVSLAGTVNIGKESWVGIGSVVINNVKLCNNCILGAGSVVIKDIVEPGTYVGVPIRRVIK